MQNKTKQNKKEKIVSLVKDTKKIYYRTLDRNKIADNKHFVKLKTQPQVWWPIDVIVENKNK